MFLTTPIVVFYILHYFERKVKLTELISMFKKYFPDFKSEIKDVESQEFVQELKQYPHHGERNTIFEHSVKVAFVVYILCLIFRVSPWIRHSAVIAALLHDCFGFNWHNKDDVRMHSIKYEHGFNKIKKLHVLNHGNLAIENSEKYIELNERQEDAIRKHMFPAYPIPPKYLEGWFLTIADKIVAAKECFEAFLYD